MASNTSLQETIEDELSCPVCFERYDSATRLPKALPCFHTFCQPCLMTMQAKSKEETFHCPVCNIRVVRLAPGTQFRTNLTIISLLERMKSEPSTPKRDQAPKLQELKGSKKCSSHINKTVTHVCTDCWQQMCTKCLTELLKSPTVGKHSHTVEEIEDAWLTAENQLKKHLAEIAASVTKKTKLDENRVDHCEQLRHQLKARVQQEVDKKIQIIYDEQKALNAKIDTSLQNDTGDEKLKLNFNYLKQLQRYAEVALRDQRLTHAFSILRSCRKYKLIQHDLVNQSASLPMAFFKPTYDPMHKILGTIHTKATSMNDVSLNSQQLTTVPKVKPVQLVPSWFAPSAASSSQIVPSSPSTYTRYPASTSPAPGPSRRYSTSASPSASSSSPSASSSSSSAWSSTSSSSGSGKTILRLTKHSSPNQSTYGMSVKRSKHS